MHDDVVPVPVQSAAQQATYEADFEEYADDFEPFPGKEEQAASTRNTSEAFRPSQPPSMINSLRRNEEKDSILQKTASAKHATKPVLQDYEDDFEKVVEKDGDSSPAPPSSFMVSSQQTITRANHPGRMRGAGPEKGVDGLLSLL